MSALPQERFTVRDVSSCARTFSQKRKWLQLANIAWRWAQGSDQEALAIADSAMDPEYWAGDDFLNSKWQKNFDRHTEEVVDDSVQDVALANDGRRLDEVQCQLASDVRVRELLADAYNDYLGDVEPEPVIAIETEKSSTNLNPIRLVVVNDRPEDTAAERGLKLYEGRQNEMRLLYDQYDSEIASKYLEGK